MFSHIVAKRNKDSAMLFYQLSYYNDNIAIASTLADLSLAYYDNCKDFKFWIHAGLRLNNPKLDIIYKLIGWVYFTGVYYAQNFDSVLFFV